jgi:hypothetical protein
MTAASEPDYWAEIEDWWEGRSTRPEPVRPGPVRGALLAAAMFGLAEAIEPVKREQAVIEVEVDEPERVPGRVHVWLDPGAPRRSVAIVPREHPRARVRPQGVGRAQHET